MARLAVFTDQGFCLILSEKKKSYLVSGKSQEPPQVPHALHPMDLSLFPSTLVAGSWGVLTHMSCSPVLEGRVLAEAPSPKKGRGAGGPVHHV